MRWLVWSILTFALAAAVALAARFNHGNVALLWPPYRIDVSLNLALLLLAAAFGLLHLALIGLSGAFRLPARVREYKERRAAQRQAAALHDALIALFEGRFGRAERLCRIAQESPLTAGIAALVAARAAHRMRELTRSEQWMQRVGTYPALRNAELMTRAELALEQHDAAAAIAAIDTMHKGGARHIHALRIALHAYEQAQDWSNVLRLISQLEKRDALHGVPVSRLRTVAYRELLRERTPNAAALRKLWSTVPSADRVQPELALDAADAFCAARDIPGAQSVLESALDEAWSDQLGARYAALPEVSVRHRLDRVEAWRIRYGEEPGLLRVLGELCVAERLWGKAQTTLEQSLAREPSAATHLALARLFESTDRLEQAAAEYRQSALLAAGGMQPSAAIELSRA